MKKLLFILSAAALLFAGCAKEMLSSNIGEGEQDVTFTVGVEANVTKAVADGDGAAENVNHWVMEVLDADGDRYNYQEEDATAGVLTHTFTVRLVKGQTYNVLFWADTKGNYDVTKLTEVKLADQTTYAANLDARDAFSAVVANFESTQASSQTVTLKRPLAQMNVIFTDLKKLYDTIGDATEYAKFKPVDFVATAKVPTTFNVLTQVAGAPATTALTMTAADNYKDNYSAHAENATLFMDYFFATAGSKDIVDVDFSFTSKGVQIAHAFTSVPYQRNYRTNIKGALLTTTGKWNVTVDPIWESSQAGAQEIVYEVVADIASANTVIANEIASGKSEISVKFTSQPNDAGTPGSTTGDITSKAIVTTNLPADGALNILVEAQTKDLYIGDYTSETNTTVVTSGTNAAAVNINIPAGSGIQKLVINAPSKTVYLNGVQVASTGEITDLDAITSNNTLIIEKGQTVGTLTMRQGGLEIHGPVTTVVIPDGHGAIYVRDCEGLSQAVYNVLEPYIDADNGYVGELEEGKSTYKIYQGLTQVAKIGNKIYYSLQKAFDNVADGQTIELLANLTQTTGVKFDKNITATFDLKGYTFKVTDDTQNNHRAIKVTKGTLVVKNGVVDARNVNAQGEPTAIISDNFDGIYGAFRAEDGTTLNLKDLNVYNNHFFGLSCKYSTGSTGEIDGCTFYSNYGGSVEAAGGTVTLKNSTVHQEGVTTDSGFDFIACGIGTSYNGTVNVTSCQIEAVCPFVEMPSGGVINVNGGTYATNTQNGSVAFLDETYVEQDHNYLYLSSGNFSGKLTTHYVDAFKNYHIIISGGTYTVDPSTYVADGYVADAQGTTPQTWKVSKMTGYSVVCKSVETSGLVDKGPMMYKYSLSNWNNLPYNIANTFINTCGSFTSGTGYGSFSAKYPCFVEITLKTDYDQNLSLQGQKVIVPSDVNYTGTITAATRYALETSTGTNGEKIYQAVQAGFGGIHCTIIESLRLIQAAGSGQIEILADNVTYPTNYTDICKLAPGMTIKMNGHKFAITQPVAIDGYKVVYDSTTDTYSVEAK